MAFNAAAAKQAGYSDSEIVDYLAGQRGFDAPGARKSGYSDSEIISHLSSSSTPSQSDDPSMLGAGARGLVRGAIPAAGGYAGAVVGAGIGGAFGGPAAPLTALAGAVIGGFGGGYGMAALQEKALGMAPEGFKRFIGQDEETRRKDYEKQKLSSLGGEIVAGLPYMGIGVTRNLLRPGASMLERVAANPKTQVALGAGIGGAQQAGMELAQTGEIDPWSVALAAGAGSVMNRPTRLGRRIAAPINNVFQGVGLPVGVYGDNPELLAALEARQKAAAEPTLPGIDTPQPIPVVEGETVIERLNRGASADPAAPPPKYDPVLTAELGRLRADPKNRAAISLADQIEAGIDSGTHTPTQSYMALHHFGNAVHDVLGGKNNDLEINLVSRLLGPDGGNAQGVFEPGGGALGEGLIQFSMDPKQLLTFGPETGAHEIFHTVQEGLKFSDPKAYNALKRQYNENTTLASLPKGTQSILKSTIYPVQRGDAEPRTVWDVMVEGQTVKDADGNIVTTGEQNPWGSGREAQAHVEGALHAIRAGGVKMPVREAPLQRYSNTISEIGTRLKNGFTKAGFQTADDVLKAYAGGKAGGADPMALNAAAASADYRDTPEAVAARAKEDDQVAKAYAEREAEEGPDQRSLFSARMPDGTMLNEANDEAGVLSLQNRKYQYELDRLNKRVDAADKQYAAYQRMGPKLSRDLFDLKADARKDAQAAHVERELFKHKAGSPLHDYAGISSKQYSARQTDNISSLKEQEAAIKKQIERLKANPVGPVTPDGLVGPEHWAEVDRLDAEMDSVRQALKTAEAYADDSNTYMPGSTQRQVNFENWFGQPARSMYDKQGKPAVFHHLTRQDFEAFDPAQSGLGTHFGTYDHANSRSYTDAAKYEVTRGWQAASEQDGPVVSKELSVPVHLNLKNPVRTIDHGNWVPRDVARSLSDDGRLSQEVVRDIENLPYDKDSANKLIRKGLKERGYDGIVYLNRHEGLKKGSRGLIGQDATDAAVRVAAPEARDSFIVFDAEQSKSVFNRGTYDPQDPRYMYSKRNISDDENIPLTDEDYDAPVATKFTERKVPDNFLQESNVPVARYLSAPESYTASFLTADGKIIGSTETFKTHERFLGDVAGGDLYHDSQAEYNLARIAMKTDVNGKRSLNIELVEGQTLNDKQAMAIRRLANARGKEQIGPTEIYADIKSRTNGENISSKSYPSTKVDEAIDYYNEAAAGVDKMLPYERAPIIDTGPNARYSSRQINTPEFKNWFGASKVLDKDGNPLRVYHGTTRDIRRFLKKFSGSNMGAVEDSEGVFYYTSSPDVAASYAKFHSEDEPGTYAKKWTLFDKNGKKVASRAVSDPWDSDISFDVHERLEKRAEKLGLEGYKIVPETPETGANIVPVYLRMENPYIVDAGGEGYAGSGMPMAPGIKGALDLAKIIKKAKANGHDGVIMKNFTDPGGEAVYDYDRNGYNASGHMPSEEPSDVYIAFNGKQVKSAIGNRGTFDPKSSRIDYSARRTDFDGDTPVSPEIAYSRRKAAALAAGIPGLDARMEAVNAPIPVNKSLLQRLNDASKFMTATTTREKAYAAMVDADYGVGKIDKAWAKKHAAQLVPGLQVIDRSTGPELVLNISSYKLRSLTTRTAGLAQADMFSAPVALTADGDLTTSKVGADGMLQKPVVQSGKHKGREIGGLFDIWKDAYTYGVGDVFHYYMDATRATRLMGEGREKLFTPADTAIAKQLEQKFDGQNGMPNFKDMAEMVHEFNVVKMDGMVKAGAISRAGADKLLSTGDYASFYREYEKDGVAGPVYVDGVNTGESVLRTKLKGSDAKLADPLERWFRHSQAMNHAMLSNESTARAINQAVDLGVARKAVVGDSENIINVRRNGDLIKYVVDDPMLHQSLASVDGKPLNAMMEILRVPTNILRKFTTSVPTFPIMNAARDSFTAFITGDGKPIYPLLDAVRGFNSALKNSASMQALANHGITGNYDYIPTPGKNMGDKVRRQAAERLGLKIDEVSGYKDLWRKLSTKYEKYLNAGDAAVRTKIYDVEMAKHGNPAEAAYQAGMKGVNFQRRGSSQAMSWAIAAVPFLNARIQGTDLIFRTMYNQGKHGGLPGVLFSRGMAVAAMTAAYYLMMRDNEVYKKASSVYKDGYWIVPLNIFDKDSDEAFVMPIPFEAGVVYKNIPEHLMRAFFGDDRSEDLTRALTVALTNTLKINPIPQAVLPLAEAVVNYSTYTGRAIVPEGQKMPGAEKYEVSPHTSLLARTMGKATNYSPIKIDHLMRGYFGTVGEWVTEFSDVAGRGVGALPPIPDQFIDNPEASNTPFLKRFVRSSRRMGNEELERLYSLHGETQGLVRTINRLKGAGDGEAILELYNENKGTMAVSDMVNGLFSQVSKLNKMQMNIQSNVKMSAPEKDRLITMIEDRKYALSRQVETLREARKNVNSRN